MAHERIVIYPFKQHKDFHELRDSWGLARLNKRNKNPEREDLPDYEFYTFDDSSVKKLKARISGWVGPDIVIYIVGHCGVGSKTLCRREDPSGMNITATSLATAINKLGLPVAYAGKIKIYACNSAVPSKEGYSFAFRFAVTMRLLKYSNCEISGYSNVVSNGYIGEHKIAANEADIDKVRGEDTGAVNDNRAKKSRAIMDVSQEFLESLFAGNKK